MCDIIVYIWTLINTRPKIEICVKLTFLIIISINIKEINADNQLKVFEKNHDCTVLFRLNRTKAIFSFKYNYREYNISSVFNNKKINYYQNDYISVWKLHSTWKIITVLNVCRPLKRLLRKQYYINLKSTSLRLYRLPESE